MSKILEKISQKKLAIIFILIASIVICIPLLNKDIDITYDDGIQHICRLMGTEQSIQEGQVFPVIMSKFCNGFGYSWNIFYSPTTAFVPLIFRIIGMNFTNCIKIFMFLVVFLSGFFMYKFVKSVTRKNNVAILAAMLYILLPYRITDMYIRNALAELTSFIFLPLVFYGLYNIFEKKNKKQYILAIGAIGLILTHTIVALYTAIFAFIYTLVNIKKLKNKEIVKSLVINLIFIIVITSFFWAPLLEHRISADYEVFKSGRMERTEVLKAFKLSLHELLYSQDDGGMIYEIGLITLIGLILTPFTIKKVKTKRYFKLYLFMLISGISCIIMTLKIFPFEYMPAVLKMIQFTFRLLEFSGFFLAFVVAVNFGILVKKLKITDISILTLILIILTFILIDKVHYFPNFDENVLWPAVSVTNNTGRVHAGMASFEYLPCRAFENRSYIENRDNKVHVLSGNTQISNDYKQDTNMEFDIEYTLEKTTLELPYIYYLGYSAYLENDNMVKLEMFESENGFVSINIPEFAQGKVVVKYTGTLVMKLSMVVSFIGFTILLLLLTIKVSKYIK